MNIDLQARRAAPRRRLAWAACGVLVLLPIGCDRAEIGGGAGTWTSEEARGGDRDGEATLVRVGRMRVGEIRSSLEVSTDVDAEHRVDVFAKVGPAFVAGIEVLEGDRVEVGQPLLRLDDIDFRIAVRRAESQALQAEQRLAQLELSQDETKARERALFAAMEKARTAWERARNAMQGDIDVLSDRELKDAELDFQQREAEHLGAKLAIDRARSDIELARLEVEAAKIELEAQQNDLDQCVVRAPITGMVETRDVDPGLLVHSATHLFTLVDPTRLIANLRVPQEELLRLRVGQPVEFRLDAVPRQVFAGAIEALNPSVDPASGLIKARARLHDAAVGAVRPGMFARARIVLESRDDALLLTKRAIVYQDGEPCIFAVADGFARRLLLRTGAATATEVEVLEIEGAPPDPALDVIVVGQDRLRDGDPVEVAVAPPGESP